MEYPHLKLSMYVCTRFINYLKRGGGNLMTTNQQAQGTSFGFHNEMPFRWPPIVVWTSCRPVNESGQSSDLRLGPKPKEKDLAHNPCSVYQTVSSQAAAVAWKGLWAAPSPFSLHGLLFLGKHGLREPSAGRKLCRRLPAQCLLAWR